MRQGIFGIFVSADTWIALAQIITNPMLRDYFKNLEQKAPSDSPLELNKIIDKLAYNEAGLIPVITQDAVLMLAWMNKETLLLTISTKRMTYWSRRVESDCGKKVKQVGTCNKLLSRCLSIVMVTRYSVRSTRLAPPVIQGVRIVFISRSMSKNNRFPSILRLKKYLVPMKKPPINNNGYEQYSGYSSKNSTVRAFITKFRPS